MHVIEVDGRKIDSDTGEILEIREKRIGKSELTVLKDLTKNGKERPWSEKKQMSQQTAGIFEEAALLSKAERMKTCADFLTFNKTDEGGLKLNQTFFCKVRLCPMCNWRRSMKLALENKKVVEEANKRHKLRWIFLTLTVANCKGDKLRDTITDMMNGFNRLTKYKQVDDSIVGWFRALEITKNNKDNSYHPHYHMLIAVQPSYFTKKGKYINQADWTSLWQKAMNLDYTPVVHVEAVKARKTKKDFAEIVSDIEKEISDVQALQKAVLETSKYTVKDAELLKGTRKQNIETVFTLDGAIERKRLVGYGGELKKIHKALNLEDNEDDLIHIDGDDKDEISIEIQKVTAKWNIGLKQYIIT